MSGLEVISAGPWASLQDGGREGWVGQGLSPAGVVDRDARNEAACLLGADPGLGIETAGPLQLKALTALTVALTGAPAAAQINERAVAPHSAFRMEPGDVLALRAPEGGQFTLISVAGGIDAPPHFGSASVDYAAGIGQPLAAGDRLTCPGTPLPAREDHAIEPLPREMRTPLRFTPSLHHDLLSDHLRAALLAGPWEVARSGRTGVALSGARLELPEGIRNVVSDFTLPGDLQILGDGTPFVLGPEGQSMGGYPRPLRLIGPDRPRLAQAVPGTKLSIDIITREAALALQAEAEAALAKLRPKPIKRALTAEALLQAQLIDGVIAAEPEPNEESLPC